MFDCEYHDQCLNNALCKICKGTKRLLKLPKPKPEKKGGKRLGSSFEKKVKKLHQKKTGEIARETVNSGAVWFDKADISTKHLLLEAKDRGAITSKGEHQFTIKKEWLEKVEEETSSDQMPGLVFQFKDDKKTYIVMDYNDICLLLNKINDLES